MSVARRFRVRRVTVEAGVTLAVKLPPGGGWDHVSIGNAGASDLKVFSEDPAVYLANDNYLVVAAGYERMIAAPAGKTAMFRFREEETAFWLAFSDPAVTGTVVLIWA